MTKRGFVLAAVMTGLLASGCAKATGAAGPSLASNSPETVRVDLNDNQKTISLSVGDTLVVDLPVPPKGSGWTLLDWPRDILGTSPVVGGPARFPYTFIARHAGDGRIVAINRTGCDGMRAAAPPACLAAPDLSQLMPELLFAVTIQVTG